MTHVQSMLDAYPQDLGSINKEKLVECAQHASMHRPCNVCAEACRRCEQACAELLASLG